MTIKSRSNGGVGACNAETHDLIFRVSFLVMFPTSAVHLLIPSPCILLPTPLFSYILLSLNFFVHRFSSSSVGRPGATKLLRAVDP